MFFQLTTLHSMGHHQTTNAAIVGSSASASSSDSLDNNRTVPVSTSVLSLTPNPDDDLKMLTCKAHVDDGNNNNNNYEEKQNSTILDILCELTSLRGRLHYMISDELQFTMV